MNVYAASYSSLLWSLMTLACLHRIKTGGEWWISDWAIAGLAIANVAVLACCLMGRGPSND